MMDHLTRRRFIGGLAITGAAALLEACGTAPAASPPVTGSAAPASTSGVAASGSAAPNASVAASAKPAGPAASPGSAASSTAKRPLDVVKRGNLRGITFAAAIAKERGYFQELGVDDQETIFASGSEQTQAIASGQLEMGATSITAAFFNAMARGVRQPWVLDNWHLEKGDQSSMVVLRPDLTSTVTKLTDLKGLKNASSTPIEEGGFGVTAQKMFQTVGLKVEDIDWVTVSFPDMLAALGNKAIDAAWLIEPFITLGKAKNLLAPWLNMGDFDPGAQIAGLVYADTFIKNRLDVAKRWAVGYVRGIRDFVDYKKTKKNADTIGPLLAKYTGIPPNLIDQAGLGPLEPDGKTNIDSVMTAQRQLQAWGKIQQVLPAEQFIDQQFVDYAVQQLGPYKA